MSSASTHIGKVSLSLESGPRMWVFRDGKRPVSTALLHERLNQEISSGGSAFKVLLRAGELEAALDDAEHGSDSWQVTALTDRAAFALVHHGDNTAFHATPIPRPSSGSRAPAEVSVGTPEGFAFYLLHPLAFRELARQVHPAGAPAAVIGIRSIGAVLSAVVGATLNAERITVRPLGHPYERSVAFSPDQEAWIRGQLARSAHFYVVDEGPGFSGSSLLSTGEALERAGVPLGRISILCTAQADPARLVTPNAAARWQRFRFYTTQPYLPSAVGPENARWYGPEHWRQRTYGLDESLWPGVWRQVENPKFLARDDHRLYRFIGYAHYGSPVLERYQRLAAAGFGPQAGGENEGFAEFWMEGGSAFTTPKWNQNIHQFVVRYLAERIRLCPAEAADAERGLTGIARMMHYNTQDLSGRAYEAQLRTEYPVYADNRMMPHKFMRTPYGMRKLDGAAHGDDHFFPGPCDIAWDIAGVIVEWELSETACGQLLRDYSGRSGDMHIRLRLRDWMIAYLAFRAGYCLMGGHANRQSAEGDRLLRDATRYHQLLLKAMSFSAPCSYAAPPP
ncbi:MAG: hypothetical protein ABI383_10385 [Acidobacteriaceae bacterium]